MKERSRLFLGAAGAFTASAMVIVGVAVACSVGVIDERAHALPGSAIVVHGVAPAPVAAPRGDTGARNDASAQDDGASDAPGDTTLEDKASHSGAASDAQAAVSDTLQTVEAPESVAIESAPHSSDPGRIHRRPQSSQEDSEAEQLRRDAMRRPDTKRGAPSPDPQRYAKERDAKERDAQRPDARQPHLRRVEPRSIVDPPSLQAEAEAEAEAEAPAEAPAQTKAPAKSDESNRRPASHVRSSRVSAPPEISLQELWAQDRDEGQDRAASAELDWKD